MNTRFFYFNTDLCTEQAVSLLFLLCCFRLGQILYGNAFSGGCFDVLFLRYLGYFLIPYKAIVDNDSLRSAFACAICLNTSMWSISSLSSGAVRESILMNLRIAEVKVSRSLSHCPHSDNSQCGYWPGSRSRGLPYRRCPQSTPPSFFQTQILRSSYRGRLPAWDPDDNLCTSSITYFLIRFHFDFTTGI